MNHPQGCKPWELDNSRTQLLYEIRGLARALERGGRWKSSKSHKRQKRIAELAERADQVEQTVVIMRALKRRATEEGTPKAES